MIKMINVQLYGHGSNNAVIKMPSRQNPGVVVQADTLQALARDARELFERLQSSKDLAEAVDEAGALADRLEEMFAHLSTEVAAAGEQINV